MTNTVTTNDPITFNDGFVTETFIQSLANIANKVTPTNLGTSLTQQLPDALLNDFSLTQGIFARFAGSQRKNFVTNLFSSYLQSNLSLLSSNSPNAFSQFLSGWYTFAQSQGLVVQSQNSLYQALVNQFTSALGIQLDGNNQLITSSGDWSILFTPPAANVSTDFSNPNDPNNPFVQAMNKFLPIFAAAAQADPNTVASTVFSQQLENFDTTTTVLQDPTTSGVNPIFNNLQSYQMIFKAFGPPDPTGALFAEQIKQFYNNQVSQNGSFVPSQAFGDWFHMLQTQYSNIPIPSLSGSSIAGNGSDQAQILERILRLIVGLIGTLQSVGISQANRLTYLTKYQQAYTTLQTQIPVFLQGDKSPISSTSMNDQQSRNDLNSSFNGILTDNLRSLRSIQENNAKQVQANINTTNDAVNQQTDMATTFLQELTTILAAIFH